MSEIDVQNITVQLVVGRSDSKGYQLVDVTYWTAHDVLEQHNLTMRSVRACPKCYGPVAEGVCLCCYASLPPEKDEAWHGVIMSGPTATVSVNLARIVERIPRVHSITAYFMPFSPADEASLVAHARGSIDDLMDLGNYVVYPMERLQLDMATGAPMSAMLENFLKMVQ